MKCPRCGTEVPDDSAFCFECGYPVSKDARKKTQLHVELGKTQPVATDSLDDKVHQAAVSQGSRGETVRMPSPGSQGDTHRINPTNPPDMQDAPTRVQQDKDKRRKELETYITTPATKVMFGEETEVGDVDAGFDRIGGSSASGSVPPAVVGSSDTQADDTNVQENDDASAEENPYNAKKKKRPWLIPLIIVLAIVAGAGIFFYVRSTQQVTMPDLSGLSEDDATKAVQDVGLVADVEHTYVDGDGGYVLSQEVPANQTVRRGSHVRFTVGQGRIMPDIIGKSKDDAMAALNEMGVGGYHLAYQNSSKENDTVLAVDPDVGQPFSSTDTITLTLAQDFVVPDVIGMAEDEAVKELEQSGLKANVSYVDADSGAGTVQSSDPQAGTKVAEGQTINLSVVKKDDDKDADTGLTDARHVADYLSARPQSVATFMSQQGYTLRTGSITNSDYAQCSYAKDDADTLYFTPEPHSKSANSSDVQDVLSRGAAIAGVRLELVSSYMDGLSGVSEASVERIMKDCALNSEQASITNVPEADDNSSDTTDTGEGEDTSKDTETSAAASSSETNQANDTLSNRPRFRCTVGTSGNNVWTVLVYQQGSSTAGVVTCAPRSAYSQQHGDYKQITTYAAQTYLAQ
jgi:beta-lactam-binding protein with PASTA domain